MKNKSDQQKKIQKTSYYGIWKKGLYNLSIKQDFTFFNLFLPQPSPLQCHLAWLLTLSCYLYYQNSLIRFSRSSLARVFLTNARPSAILPKFLIELISSASFSINIQVFGSVSLWLREMRPTSTTFLVLYCYIKLLLLFGQPKKLSEFT